MRLTLTSFLLYVVIIWARVLVQRKIVKVNCSLKRQWFYTITYVDSLFI